MMRYLFSVFALALGIANLAGQEKFTDQRDGNIYSTISIDGSVWMKENLRFKGVEGAHCFDNDTNNISIYGALYEWKAALNACPAGWHLPSGVEFGKLTNHFENKDAWGKGPSGAFNIQLGGQQDYEGIFSEVDESGYYWTSTEYDTNNAEYFSYLIISGKKIIDISRQADIAEIHGSEKTNRYSVRCVKDN
ncbi:MAG TPA: FISUMP domain-containing protein [Bacteroidales bacterium]|nr:FISUMP domain-containing protein [Bacteroidales bacterium]